MSDLPLRSQLMWVFAALSIATTAISTAALATLSGNRLHDALSARCTQYARQLQRQLEPVIQFDDLLTARELFASIGEDSDVEGLGVYAGDGTQLDGMGVRPARLASLAADVDASPGRVISIADIQARDGRAGRLYVSLSTRLILAQQRHDAHVAAMLAAGVVLLALLLAVLMSRRIGDRLARIAAAAKRMAGGDLQHTALFDTANDEIGALAQAFNSMVRDLNALAAEHERLVLTERERLERLVRERTRTLEQSREMFKLIAESTNAVPFTLDLTRAHFPYIGTPAPTHAPQPGGPSEEEAALESVVPRATNQEIRRRFDDCGDGPFEFEGVLVSPGGAHREIRWTGTCETRQGAKHLRGLMLDVTDMRRLARELAASQKLESVGRLAAGVAHEINTPVQFAADNVQFVRASIGDIVQVVAAYRSLREAVQSDQTAAPAVRSAALCTQELEARTDLGYLIENLPQAIEGAVEGLGRIATIVRSMKEFAHPDMAQKTEADLNHAIQSTLIVARNEYKYVAEVVTEFGELPPVACYLGEINQVILNLLVNASHAIGDVVQGTGRLGTLTVRTRRDGNEVEISVGDTGTGIPQAARDKIFEPFFTTKEVGRGTGQGLAIARTVIVVKHGGTLHFETESGKGTTFYIRLPIGATPPDEPRLEPPVPQGFQGLPG